MYGRHYNNSKLSIASEEAVISKVVLSSEFIFNIRVPYNVTDRFVSSQASENLFT